MSDVKNKNKMILEELLSSAKRRESMSVFRTVLEKIKNINSLYNERGSILVLTALLLPIMFGCLGIAYDVGNIYIHKARLQNVTDAAALAGGRAYLQSQLKTGDVHIDTYDTYTNGNVTDVEYVVGSNGGISTTRDGHHPDADIAADKYIRNNIINLGEKVYSDKYSHYALRGLKKVGEDYVYDSKIFYRIGLFEKVPLYFLPVITNKNVETVRAGSVVVIEPEKTEVREWDEYIPGTGGTPTATSLFDKLFVVESGLTASRNVVSNPDDNATNTFSTIKTTFDGDMVYTGGTWSYSNALITQGHQGIRLYTKEEQEYTKANTLSISNLNMIPNTGNRTVWDTSIGIDYYVQGFLNKLKRPHIDLLEQSGVNVSTFKTSELNSLKNMDNKEHYVVTTSKGNIYYHKDGSNNIPCGGSYIHISGNTYYSLMKCSGFSDEHWQWIPCSSFVIDGNGNPIYCYKNGDTWDFYRKNLIVHTYDWGTQSEEKYQKLTVSQVSDNADGTTFSYNDNNTTIYFSMEKIDIDFSQGVKVADSEIKSSSVYHWERPSNESVLTVDGLEGDESDPLYIIITAANVIKIKVTASNERPIVFCNLTNLEINEFDINPNVTFKGVIYCPFATANNIHNGTDQQGLTPNNGGHFIGNIIAKEINIQNAGSSWTQKNFVVDDSDLNTVPDTAATAQNTRKQNAIAYAKTELASLGVNDEAWNDKDWLSKEENAGKLEAVQAAWENARLSLWQNYGLEMPDWPWSTGGKTTDLDHHHYSVETGGSTPGQTIHHTETVVLTDEKLRLINYRTEFQLKETMNNDDVVDPFIFETLRQPNSY